MAADISAREGSSQARISEAFRIENEPRISGPKSVCSVKDPVGDMYASTRAKVSPEAIDSRHVRFGRSLDLSTPVLRSMKEEILRSDTTGRYHFLAVGQ